MEGPRSLRGSSTNSGWPGPGFVTRFVTRIVKAGDKLVYVNDVLMGKLLESQTLQEQAINNLC